MPTAGSLEAYVDTDGDNGASAFVSSPILFHSPQCSNEIITKPLPILEILQALVYMSKTLKCHMPNIASITNTTPNTRPK